MPRLAVLAVTTALVLGGAAAPAAAAPPATVTVQGHVLSPTGRAVAGVRVSVRAKPRLAQTVSRVVRTSPTGRYSVRIPRGAYYDLRVTDPGDDDLDPADGTWAPTYRRITTDASSITADQVMHHGARISGRVLASTGRAVQAGLVVTAYTRTPNPDGRSALNSIVSTRTGADGTYRFRNLPARSVILSFSPPTKNDTTRWRTGRPGGSTDFHDALAVRLAYGAERTGQDLRFPVVGRISGTLTVDGKPMPGDDDRFTAVHLLDASGAEVEVETAYSAFGFPDLAAGTYYLRFEVTSPGGDLTAPEYYADSSTLAGATPITIAKGQAVTGLTVALTTR